ncbi:MULTISPECIES: ketoacyl-ACP synthase III family protein [unclassified Streptomyces]|uniref:ketoacyl-ACP synthase III family protein n=1 Tax=unclassified Streptomyces TaxID=2593676 RepID=UPI0022556DAC|nr:MULTISPECIES: ketoacyl-ACP synthase III family protein [unclassified Streptomyces]MCX5142747.1 ketoacyl-ACP synthase III family protein [Streptomyces sp. NBC_00338]WRZ67182.1 ketoacyl-ACP synthase III family protein [Streptomyces sp. NBC_01257]WSU61195.1 ketoacyl-ACP synthase III family protein [Streptomyces sp. NBC_01104]
MRFSDGLTIEATATWLPATTESGYALVADGVLDPEIPAAAGVVEVPVSHRESAPDMAVLAGRRALDGAGVRPADVGLLVHNWIYHQGHDFWSPAHYVADRIGARNALPFGIQQMCHAGAMALHTAAAHLTADPSYGTALVTTADRFGPTGFDRWRGDYQVAYGDGATAAVLGRSGNGLRLISHALRAAPDMESMYRGADAFSSAPFDHGRPLDIRRTKRAFIESGGMDLFAKTGPEAVRAVLLQSLSEAGLNADDPRIRYVALPRLGPKVLGLMYLPVIQELLTAQPLHLGARTGHLGCGDPLANLTDITAQRLLEPGEFALLLTGGGGFTWSCLVVQQTGGGAGGRRP